MQLVLCTLVLSSVVSLSAALVCQNGQNYIKIIKKSSTSAAEESFTISDGSTVLVQSVTFTNNAEQTFEYCVTQNTNSQYSLEMKDSWGDSWTNGSYMEIRGIYDNVFFKNFMADKVREQYSLSLYYPIMKTSQWKMTTGAASGWTQYSFGDSSWTTVTLGSVTSQLSGTQYFRKTFSGVSGMAAYETRLNYRYGIVAYLNGAEVYRDNMPEGAIADSTPSSGEYSEASFRGFVRPGKEVESSQSVLAVELHFTTASNNVDFDAFMALLTPTTPDAPCYIVAEGFSFTTSMSSPQNLFDWDKSSRAFKPLSRDAPIRVFWSFVGVSPFVNGLRVWPDTARDDNPTAFTWEGRNGETSYTTLIETRGVQYATNTNAYAYSFFASGLYRQYRFQVTESSGDDVDLFELQPLVCSVQPPDSIVFSPSSYTVLTDFDMVSIRPLVSEFRNCSLTPSLPTGLAFDAASCLVHGIATGTLNATDFTVSASVAGHVYSGWFTLAVEECTSVTVDLRRVYSTMASREVVSIEDSTGAVVFAVTPQSTQQSQTTTHTYLCLPFGEYRVFLGASAALWQSGSYLYVDACFSSIERETLLRTRFDSKLAIETASFSTRYAVSAKSQWFYKMNEVPANWFNGNTSGWEQSTMGSYPAATSNIQLYKKTFNVASLQNYAGVVLTLRYKFGCVIYLNNYEVFRNGVVGDLSTSSVTENIYLSLMYRTVSLPIIHFHQGTNTIAIAIVSTTSTRTSFFDCAVRLMSLTAESRVLDGWSASATGITGSPSLVFSDCSTNVVEAHACSSNAITIKFNSDRREWINAVVVQLESRQSTQQPKAFAFQARNPDDEAWTTLRAVSGLQWSQEGQAKKIYTPNLASYNQYRFENFVSGESGCDWKVGRLSLLSSAVDNVPELKYAEEGQTVNLYVGIEMAEMYPNSDAYYDFAVTPALPEGVFIDVNNGQISGTATSLKGVVVHTISARGLDGSLHRTTLHLTVIACTGDYSLITLVARLDSMPQEGSYRLHRGKSTEGAVVARNDRFMVGNGLNYVDWCLLEGLYTLELCEASDDGWTNPAGWYLMVDVGEMKFEMGQVPAGVASVSTMFSSYLPFQVNYDDWTFFKGRFVDSYWKNIDFDASGWTTDKAAAIGTNQEITTYIRREFSIPSLFDYAVLNVRVKYAGGVVAYFNSRKVARFNLAGEFDKDTQSLEAKNEPVFSQFHVILNMFGATTAKNVIAFEVHRPLNDSSSEPVVFDATGVFGVNDCSIALDSYAAVTEGYGDFFDLSPITYGTLPSEVGSYMEWTVENLEGTRFNSYAWQTAEASAGWGFSLYARKRTSDDFTSALSVLNQTVQERRRSAWSVAVGVGGYRRFRYVTDVAATNALVLSAHFFLYCKNRGAICPAIGDFPAVSEGQISPSECPDGFRGYTYRICRNGVLGDVKTDMCKYKTPSNFKYGNPHMTLVRDLPATSGAPTFKNIVTGFDILPPTLPKGLRFNSKTGVISGTPRNVSSTTEYTVFAHNPDASATTSITIAVRKGYCQPEGPFLETEVGETAIYDCGLRGKYVGIRRQSCVLGEKDGVWTEPSGYCMPIFGVVSIMVVFVLVLTTVSVFIMRIMKKRNALRKGGKSTIVRHSALF